jgi:hypothetical protein
MMVNLKTNFGEVYQEVSMYNVYVIELDKAVKDIPGFSAVNPDYNPEKPCVYVGQTAKTPEDRFSQHLAGNRANRYVRDHGQKLKPKLYERHNPLPTRTEAEEKEQWLAERLRAKGYGVWWN